MEFLLDCFRVYPIYLALLLLLVNIVCSVFRFDVRWAVSYHFFCKAGFGGSKSDIVIITNKTRFSFFALGLFFGYPAYWFLEPPLQLNGVMSIVIISITCFLYITPVLIFISSFFHAVATEGDTVFFLGTSPRLLKCTLSEVKIIGDEHGSWGIPIATLLHGTSRYTVAISGVRSVLTGTGR